MLRPSIESQPGDARMIGEKRILPSVVKIGDVAGALYVLEKTSSEEAPDAKNPVTAEIDPRKREAKEILDKARKPLSEAEVLHFYSGETPVQVEIDGTQYFAPFAGFELDQYLLNPERVGGMDYTVEKPLEIDPQLRAFKERFVELEQAAGRRLFDSDITSVGEYASSKNLVGLRRARYFDSAVTDNLGLDVNCRDITGNPLERGGRVYETIRQLESSDGKLRHFSDSLLANGFGVGGILLTKDGRLVIPQRKSGAGVVSLDGTYGLTASGGVEWDEQYLDKAGVQGYLGGRMRKEVGEELGIKARERGMNLSQHLVRNMERYVEREVGLKTSKGEVQITPLAFSRDLMRGGHPQMFYILQTQLEAAEIPERMAQASDAKKEYNQVITLPLSPELIAAILGNQIEGMKFNQEIRAALAYAYRSPEARKLMQG